MMDTGTYTNGFSHMILDMATGLYRNGCSIKSYGYWYVHE